LSNQLHSYVESVALYGSRKIAVRLTGQDINIKRLCHALRHHLGNYVASGDFRCTWFKTQTGYVLLVSGSRVVADVVAKFLAGYSDAFQEHQILYCGRGINVFKQIVDQEMKGYDKTGRSYGATR
jgi:hypothetical protein